MSAAISWDDRPRRLLISSVKQATREEPLSSEAQTIADYDDRVKWLARRFRLPASQTDDLIQVGRIALLGAARDWVTKPKLALFWTFARKAVFGAMLRHIAKERRQADLDSLGATLGMGPSVPPDAAAELGEHLAGLSDYEVKLLLARAAGRSFSDLAEERGISKTEAFRAMSGLLEQIRERA